MATKQVTIKTLGPTGSGKTFVMAFIASALKERGFTIVRQNINFATEDEMIVEFDPTEVGKAKHD